MSADKALRMERNKGFGEEVRRICDEKGIDLNEFRKQMYGVNEDGKPKSDGGFYDLMRGNTRANRLTIEKWSAALDVPPERLVAAYEVKPKPAAVPKPVKSSETVTQGLNINTQSDGSVTLTLRLEGLTIVQALAIGQGILEKLP